MRCRSKAQSGRYGGSDYRWVADWQSVQSGLITCWNMWIDKREDVLQYYAGTRSLYIKEGRQGKGRKTAPRDGARGLSHVRTPPPVRHLRTPIILTLAIVCRAADTQTHNPKPYLSIPDVISSVFPRLFAQHFASFQLSSIATQFR